MRSERSESKNLYLLFGKPTFNGVPMALRAALRHERRQVFRQSTVILSERSESKNLLLLFGKPTFNKTGTFRSRNAAAQNPASAAGRPSPGPTANLPSPLRQRNNADHYGVYRDGSI
jgi:hypothetical protein